MRPQSYTPDELEELDEEFREREERKRGKIKEHRNLKREYADDKLTKKRRRKQRS